MQKKLMIWMAGLAGVICGLSVQLVTWILTPGKPLEILSSYAITERVKPGTDAVLAFEVKRERTCPALINGFLVDEQGAAVARFDTAMAGYSPIGTTKVVVRRPVPAGVAPGRVCYRHVRTDACEERTFITPQRDVCFQVVP